MSSRRHDVTLCDFFLLGNAKKSLQNTTTVAERVSLLKLRTRFIANKIFPKLIEKLRKPFQNRHNYKLENGKPYWLEKSNLHALF